MVDVLAIGCHPDDVEISMGGALAKMVRTGISVGIVDLSNGEPTPDGTPKKRATEAEKAGRLLGAQFRITLDMPNRYILDDIESRKKVAVVIREHRPKTIITHYWDDSHPDHVQGSSIVCAARFYGKLTKTDMPHEPYFTPNMYFFPPVHIHPTLKPAFIIPLTEDDVERKLDALGCYESQFGRRLKRVYDDISISARYFGSLVGAFGGEPFFSKEEICIENIQTIL